MIVLGMANSHMKDFYDLCMMFDQFEFDGQTMQNAIQRTLQNRGAEFPTEKHTIFLSEFAENKTAQWNAFTRKIKRQDYADMKQVINTIKEFFLPARGGFHLIKIGKAGGGSQESCRKL